MELHPHRIHFRSIIITFFLAICVIVIGVVYRYQESGLFVKPDKSNTSTSNVDNENSAKQAGDDAASYTTQTAAPSERFELRSEKSGTVGQTLKINLFGTSDSKAPIGYDALVEITGGDYDVVSVEPQSKEFNILKFAKKGRVTITGILAPSVKTPTIWKNTAIATLSIKPKTAGMYTLAVLETSGPESSKIMVRNGDEGSIRLPSVKSNTVQVDIAN